MPDDDDALDGVTEPLNRVPRMHEGEVDIHAELVAKLVESQFPQWSDRVPRAVESSGTDHVTFRLGADLLARMPRTRGHVGQSEKDREWLPRLAPHLPLAVPEPLAVGEPGHGYPFTWGVYRWLDGAPVGAAMATDRQAAVDLAAFIRALRAIDATGAPLPTPGPYSRGVPLITRDGLVRECVDQARDLVDASRVTEVWDGCLTAADWAGEPAWIHADLMRGNILAHQGRLSAVIDFGALRAADPAVDLLPAWHVFDGAARRVFRDESGLDDAAWWRGLGWALSIELVAIPYYRDVAPERTRRSIALVEAIVADAES